MKIEINLEDIESLKEQIKILQKDKHELELKLKSLDEEVLKQQALDLANKIFRDVLNRVFIELGFENTILDRDIDFNNLQHYLGQTWWNSERLEIKLGANITNQFKGAYLSMGIKIDEWNKYVL